MVKKTILICLLSTTFALMEANSCTCKSQYNELTTTESVILWGGMGTGAVLAAPYVLPASAIAAIAAAATCVAPYVIPSTTVGKVGLGLTAAQYVRPCILQTTEEKLKTLLKEK